METEIIALLVGVGVAAVLALVLFSIVIPARRARARGYVITHRARLLQGVREVKALLEARGDVERSVRESVARLERECSGISRLSILEKNDWVKVRKELDRLEAELDDIISSVSAA